MSALPFDNSYARLGSPFGERVMPTGLQRPHAVAWNPDAAALLEIDPGEAEGDLWVQAFSGNVVLPGSDPVAMRYAGHQFGGWVPQLGDGRAILLGEVRTSAGRWDLHLKGAGVTPFSRGFDGRAVLRSTIREYLCGEAMHGLGIPTTRALCIVGSEEPVHREKLETAATLVRLAPSHVRIGSFEIFAARGDTDNLRKLADYVIEQHFPEISGESDRYLLFLREAVARSARMVAQWQAVGWAHGVLNTDNTSVLGLTLDYGPYGFVDDFDPHFIPNHTDVGGRYALDQQPGVILWNLSRLAQSLLPLIEREAAIAALDEYEAIFVEAYHDRFRGKLGLREAREADTDLLIEILTLLAASHTDYTRFWRMLGRLDSDAASNDALRDLFIDWAGWEAWVGRYRARLLSEGSAGEERKLRMDAANPKYVLRNYLAERAIRLAEDERDYAEIERVRELLSDPFSEQPEMDSYADLPPDWARRLSVSCSS